MQAKDIMTRDVTSVPPSEGVREAAKLMADKWLSGLPIAGGAKVEDNLKVGTPNASARWI
jgi:predicted transcriptional regulator